MLKRVRASRYSFDQFDGLIEHLVNRENPETLRNLRSLYSALPSEFKHSGDIYRGIKINEEEGGIKLLRNEAFVAQNMREYSKLESWSRDLNVGIQFARKAPVVGVVLQKRIKPSDAVMVFNEEIWEHVKANVDKEDYDWAMDHYWAEGLIPKYFREQEVTLAHKPGARYRMCDDVPYITVTARVFTDGKHVNFVKELENFVDMASLGEFDSNVVDGPFALFECQGSGSVLKFLGWKKFSEYGGDYG